MLGRRWDYSTEINIDFRVTPRFAKTVGLRSIVELKEIQNVHLISIKVF